MNERLEQFRREIREGIPDDLPPWRPLDSSKSHAPPRPAKLTAQERKLALRNALRYFPAKHHPELVKEFAEELDAYGHIYMYRLRPNYALRACPLEDIPHRCMQAAAVMMMILNNLDDVVAQHPEELVTYGGNGAVFQNWAQYRLTMKYLSELEDDQTLALYSGHPHSVFPTHLDAPRVVVTNGLLIPNFSTTEDLDRMNALGVSQYGQMTAGSFMYIGPQGIVHGTAITVLNAGRMHCPGGLAGKVFVSSGLGGMSGAQAKAGVIAGAVTVIAEVDEIALDKRHEQGWLDEKYSELDQLLERIATAREERKAVSLGYCGNIVDLWERFVAEEIPIDIGSDQTSLHNPYGGGYYPVGLSFEESKEVLSADPERFRQLVHDSLRRQVKAIDAMCERGMYFFDYGNSFLFEAKQAGISITREDGSFRYPSYVEDIMGPLCFDYGFGPFRWVCTSCKESDLQTTDRIAAEVFEELIREAPPEISQQLQDNLQWIKAAAEAKLVVGSQARILYSNSDGRVRLALAFNDAVREGVVSAPIVLGRDHHDVSGTDSPFRETADIRDGSSFTCDMAVHNVIGDAFRGATWVSLHNGGGVGAGKAINGGFGLVLDGSEDAARRAQQMLYWDVNNGVARRAWAGNEAAVFSVERELKNNQRLKVTLPFQADDDLIDGV